MILVFILFSYLIVGEILQPPWTHGHGGHVQGKGILIAGMTTDKSTSRFNIIFVTKITLPTGI